MKNKENIEKALLFFEWIINYCNYAGGFSCDLQTIEGWINGTEEDEDYEERYAQSDDSYYIFDLAEAKALIIDMIKN